MAWRRGDRGTEVAAIRATLAGMGLLHDIDAAGVTEPETGTVLARTDAVYDVAQLRRRLGDLGFYAGIVDGTFAGVTHAAVTEFQRDCGLTADGVVEAETLDTLGRFSTLFAGGDVSSLVEKERVRTSGPML